MADGHTFEKPFQAEAEEHELPCCEECGCEDDDLRDGLCPECFENSVDGSWAAMRSAHGTWSV